MFFFDTGLPNWANKIRELTIRSGLTQAELARRTGVNRDAFGRYHNGVTKPPPQKLIMLARAFGVRPSEIDPEFSHLDDAELTDPAATQPYSISPPTDGNPSHVHLDVSCDLPITVAMRLIEILQTEIDEDGNQENAVFS